MTICIHALGANMGGAMRHLTLLLPELAICDDRRRYVILVRESFPEFPLPGNIVVERVPDAQADGWPRRIWNDVCVFPKFLRRGNFEAVVSLMNFGPVWSPVPHVLFQCNALYYSPYYLKRVTGILKLETVSRRHLALASMKRARLIVTPSHSMAQMIKEMFPEAAGFPFRTLYHGFDRETLQREPLDPEIRRLLDRVPGWKLLYPSYAGIHKGFGILFEIASALKSKGVRFSLVATVSRDDLSGGGMGCGARLAQLGIEDNVIFTGNISQRQIGALYSMCDLMVYPSLCESFGFSMIEAMGYGMPIVAADTAINREMCEEGALYYSPFSAKAGAAAILAAMDPQVNARLREKGKLRLSSSDWSWKRYAREFREIVEEAV